MYLLYHKLFHKHSENNIHLINVYYVYVNVYRCISQRILLCVFTYVLNLLKSLFEHKNIYFLNTQRHCSLLLTRPINYPIKTLFLFSVYDKMLVDVVVRCATMYNRKA